MTAADLSVLLVERVFGRCYHYEYAKPRRRFGESGRGQSEIRCRKCKEWIPSHRFPTDDYAHPDGNRMLELIEGMRKLGWEWWIGTDGGWECELASVERDSFGPKTVIAESGSTLPEAVVATICKALKISP